jgi:error-prone DNA polymerase
MAARPFRDFAQLASAGLPHTALVGLAEADAMRGLGLDRRAALWQVRGLDRAPVLPLFGSLPIAVRPVDLPVMPLPEQVAADYQAIGLSLKAHPLRFLRVSLARQGVMSCAAATGLADGTKAYVVGIVLVRQRPGSAAGVVFATIEDETGTANIVIWTALLETYRSVVLGAAVLGVRGVVQRSPEGVVHLVAEQLENHSDELRAMAAVGPPTRADALPRSRDFR